MTKFIGSLTVALLLGAAVLADETEAKEEGATTADRAVAIFAGGCFWCMEPPYDKLDGVYSTTSGYIGGDVENPTYEQVSSGRTGHREAIKIEYDPSKVSYAKLLQVFWRNIDPLDGRGQFCDKGFQYTSAIYAVDAKQRAAAEASKEALEARGVLDGEIETEILDAGAFYPAEDYHQNYYEKNPVRYKLYRWNCGRDERLEKVWGDEAGH